MNIKIIAVLAILVLLASAVYIYIGSKATGASSQSVSASDLSLTMADGYSSIIQEELNSLSAEQTDFNDQAQDDIANDMSVYYA